MSRGPVVAAVIMAAGQGKRLRPITDEVPKAMVEVGGRPLLDRHLEVLRGWRIPRLIVVVGHKQEAPRRLLADRAEVTIVENPIFNTSGSGYSLALGLLALVAVPGDVAFMDADLLYDPELFRPLLGEPRTGNALLVGHGKEDDEEAVKVRGLAGNVHELRKKKGKPGLEFLGESVGICRLTDDGRARVLRWMAEREKTVGPDYEWEHAIEAIATELELRALKAPVLPWTEIDTVEDLAKANALLGKIRPWRGP